MPSRSLSMRYASHSFAACWFLENFHTIQTFGAAALTRLPGSPWGSRPRKVLWNTGGLVSTVVRYAEIASWTQHAIPEARYRLSDASSQEKTSGVMPSSKMALANLRNSRSSLESIVGWSPEGVASVPPWLKKHDRHMRFASAHCERAIPVGCPLAFSVRAATRASSQVSGYFRLLASNRSLR